MKALTFLSKPNAIPVGDKNCSTSHRNFAFTSQRNGVWLQTGIAFTIDRIPHLISENFALRGNNCRLCTQLSSDHFPIVERP